MKKVAENSLSKVRDDVSLSDKPETAEPSTTKDVKGSSSRSGKVKRNSEELTSASLAESQARRRKIGWLAALLIPLSFLFPMMGEVIRNETIGREFICCMPENRAELEKKAQRAKELRWLSNTIIIGSDLLGFMAIVAGYVVFIKLVIIRSSDSRNKKVIFIVLVTVVSLVMLAFEGDIFIRYIFDTEHYYNYIQPYFNGYYLSPR